MGLPGPQEMDRGRKGEMGMNTRILLVIGLCAAAAGAAAIVASTTGGYLPLAVTSLTGASSPSSTIAAGSSGLRLNVRRRNGV